MEIVEYKIPNNCRDGGVAFGPCLINGVLVFTTHYQPGIAPGYMGIYTGIWSSVGQRVYLVQNNGIPKLLGHFALSFEYVTQGGFGRQTAWSESFGGIEVDKGSIIVNIKKTFFKQKLQTRRFWPYKGYPPEEETRLVYSSEIENTSTRQLIFKFSEC